MKWLAIVIAALAWGLLFLFEREDDEECEP